MLTPLKWLAPPLLTMGLLAATDSPQANAQSFSFGTRGLSIQIGQPYPSYYSRVPSRYYSRYSGYRSPYYTPYRYGYGPYGYSVGQFYRFGSPYTRYPGYYDQRFGPSCRHGSRR